MWRVYPFKTWPAHDKRRTKDRNSNPEAERPFTTAFQLILS